MSEKTVWAKCELTGCVSFEYLEIVISAKPWNENVYDDVKLLVHKDLIHSEIPQAEPKFGLNPLQLENDTLKRQIATMEKIYKEPANEWSPDKFYDWFEAMYWARKYDLEVRNINSENWKIHSYWELTPHNHSEQIWQLRKPKPTVDDRLNDILTFGGSQDKMIQAIKDVFKEEN